MDEKINLLDLSMEELEGLALKLGEEKYRGRQVFKWLYRGVKDIDLMTDLSKAFREVLKEKAFIGGARVADKRVSKVDGTAKYLLELHDGNMIESVLMEYKYGLSICVSSQVGCRMGCRFCASSGVGFVRNLSPGEMLDQVLLLQADRGERIGHVVIMGIGEPLDNYDNVLKFLRTVNHPEGLNISYRNISLSTCGLVPRIIRLARVKIPITLSVSLHAPNDEVRRKLMPVALKYSIDKLIEACKIYTEITGRRVSFEYALISGLNDSVKDAAELSRRLKGMLCHVNLIPVNKVVGRQYTRSSYKTIERFRDVLAEHGIQATVRRELGSDIEAACGQLRRSVMAKRQPPGDGKDGQ